MEQGDAKTLKSIIAAASFAAIISVANLMAFFLPGLAVPIVVQNMLAVLAGLLLGPLWGGLAVLAFLVLGAIGLPVFSGGAGGIQYMLGRTGGFLIGYLLASVLSGFIAGDKEKAGAFRLSIAALSGFILIYACGIAWMSVSMGLSPIDAGAKVLFPFVFIDLGKCAVAVALALGLRKLVRGLLKD